jgi:hypothetical protein
MSRAGENTPRPTVLLPGKRLRFWGARQQTLSKQLPVGRYRVARPLSASCQVPAPRSNQVGSNVPLQSSKKQDRSASDVILSVVRCKPRQDLRQAASNRGGGLGAPCDGSWGQMAQDGQW